MKSGIQTSSSIDDTFDETGKDAKGLIHPITLTRARELARDNWLVSSFRKNLPLVYLVEAGYYVPAVLYFFTHDGLRQKAAAVLSATFISVAIIITSHLYRKAHDSAAEDIYEQRNGLNIIHDRNTQSYQERRKVYPNEYVTE